MTPATKKKQGPAHSAKPPEQPRRHTAHSFLTLLPSDQAPTALPPRHMCQVFNFICVWISKTRPQHSADAGDQRKDEIKEQNLRSLLLTSVTAAGLLLKILDYSFVFSYRVVFESYFQFSFMSLPPLVPIIPFSAMKTHPATCTIPFFFFNQLILILILISAQVKLNMACSGHSVHTSAVGWQGVTVDPNNARASSNHYCDMLRLELLLYRFQDFSSFYLLFLSFSNSLHLCVQKYQQKNKIQYKCCILFFYKRIKILLFIRDTITSLICLFLVF